jgi:hypothetical protein
MVTQAEPGRNRRPSRCVALRIAFTRTLDGFSYPSGRGRLAPMDPTEPVLAPVRVPVFAPVLSEWDDKS